jgi:hypothetical protein
VPLAQVMGQRLVQKPAQQVLAFRIAPLKIE